MLSPATTDAAVDLGHLALLFGRVNRVTYHPDGMTSESDTDHTVMLALVACALAPHLAAELNIGRVAQHCLVHDLVEAYAGDTSTLHGLDEASRADKEHREQMAYLRIAEEFGLTLPWLATTIAEYEARVTPEARYVWTLDKLMPKITHLANNCVTLRETSMSYVALHQRYTDQLAEISTYAGDFPEVLELYRTLAARVLARYRVVVGLD